MNFRNIFENVFFENHLEPKICQSILMILGALKARSQCAFNAANTIQIDLQIIEIIIANVHVILMYDISQLLWIDGLQRAVGVGSKEFKK